MKPDPADFLAAARVPATLAPQRFGLWEIERRWFPAGSAPARHCGAEQQTALRRLSWRSLHSDAGEIVMEDSRMELARHLPIFMAARGRVLISGLGLGCVLRGLLIKPEVEHVDVVELDPGILRVVGAEFRGHPRVTLHFGDALTVRWPRATAWDFAWHDVWVDGPGLDRLHTRLIGRYHRRCRHQGAWQMPRPVLAALARRDIRLLGAPRPPQGRRQAA